MGGFTLNAFSTYTSLYTTKLITKLYSARKYRANFVFVCSSILKFSYAFFRLRFTLKSQEYAYIQSLKRNSENKMMEHRNDKMALQWHRDSQAKEPVTRAGSTNSFWMVMAFVCALSLPGIWNSVIKIKGLSFQIYFSSSALSSSSVSLPHRSDGKSVWRASSILELSSQDGRQAQATQSAKTATAAS